MTYKFNVTTKISFFQYLITVLFFLISIFLSFIGFNFLSFIFTFLLFYKAYKIYLKFKYKVKEIEIDGEMVRLYNLENKIVLEDNKANLIFDELGNGLYGLNSKSSKTIYLDFLGKDNEVKEVIGQKSFSKLKKESYFSLDSILDIIDLFR
ncbi:hypothetical protein [Flavobacterium sp.]|uniref:hypothetical protein n=1 Tax=Flavobacterium sp. TaxID=239 RepID=UPI003D0B0F7D